MSRRSVADWRREVYRSKSIGDGVRVLLIRLSEDMRSNRIVSVPRERLAKDLGRTPRRISQRVQEAHEAGFLTTVAPGHRGQTAVYQGLFPTGERVTRTSTHSMSETDTLSPLERVPPGGPTTTETTHCQWHDWQPCPTDCANYIEESA